MDNVKCEIAGMEGVDGETTIRNKKFLCKYCPIGCSKDRYDPKYLHFSGWVKTLSRDEICRLETLYNMRKNRENDKLRQQVLDLQNALNALNATGDGVTDADMEKIKLLATLTGIQVVQKTSNAATAATTATTTTSTRRQPRKIKKMEVSDIIG
jgi:hypothetical protein